MFNRFIRYWLPALLWMSTIFFFSSQQRVTVSSAYSVNFAVFKTLHMIEYAFLYFLLFRSFYTSKVKSLTKTQKYLYPFLLAVLYACSDELHQLFTPHREGTPRDVVIDTLGITIAYAFIASQIDRLKILL